MEKSPKTNFFDVIKSMIQIVLDRVKTTSGRVNIAFGFLIVLVIIIAISQPIAFYVLQMIQSLLNAILTFSQKDQIPLSQSANPIIVLLICFIMFIIESVFCSIIVYLFDLKKENDKKK